MTISKASGNIDLTGVGVITNASLRLHDHSLSTLKSMTNKILTAEIAKVKIGVLEFEGLRFPDGSYGIDVFQVAELFSIPIKNAAREFKDLLGVGFQLIQAKTSLNSKPVNVLTLYQFEVLIVELSSKGNSQAKAFQLALIGLSTHQLYCDSFGVYFVADERQELVLARPDTQLKFMAFQQQLRQHGVKFTYEFGEFIEDMQSYIGFLNDTKDSAVHDTLQKLERIQIQLTELLGAIRF